MKIETEREHILCKTAVSYGQSKDIGIYALASVVNELAAEGAAAACVDADILLPLHISNSYMHGLRKCIESTCRERNIQLQEVRGERHAALSYCMVHMTGIAQAPKDQEWYREPARAGQDIVLTKWVGLEGMLRIVSERERELREKFAPSFLNQVQSYREAIFAAREIDVAKAKGVSVMLQVTDGGVFAALWNLAKEADRGLEVDIKKMSIRQETIEICERYRLNPYQLTSAGTMLMVADDGEGLADALRRNDIEASVIGRFTDNNAKIIRNGDEVRYIDRPAPDELMKLYDGGNYERD